jgi:phage-related protein
MQIKFFQSSNGSTPVQDFIVDKLEAKDQKRVMRALDRVQVAEDGLACLFRAKEARKLEKNLYEFKPGAVRIFFTLSDHICWLLHIFWKKSAKTPQKELELARARRDSILSPQL